MKGIARITAVCDGIGERPDHFKEFNDRARPTVRHDQRSCGRMRRTHVQKLEIEAVDFGDELAVRIQLRFASPPILLATPVLADFTRVCERYALAPIVRSFALRPTGECKTLFQIVEFRLGHVECEWTNGGAHQI